MLLSAAVAAALTAPAVAAENSYPADTGAPRAVVGPSLHQWKALAAAEATVLAKKIGADSGPWQLKLAEDIDSRFAQSFSKMLMSELSTRGVQLTTRPANAVIEVKVETLHHRYDTRRYDPGTLTALAAGLWAVAELAEAASTAGVATALLVGSDAALSYFKDTSDFPSRELGVTLVAANAGVVAASTTNVYLLNYRGHDEYASQPDRTLKFAK